MTKYFLFLFTINYCLSLQSQEIKSVQIRIKGKIEQQNIIPLKSSFELSFDDLEADNKDYQYKIEHMTSDWKVSNLTPSQYLNGFQQNEITNVNNSFNTQQNYTHYSITIPNQNITLTKSGNYQIYILNEYDEVILKRKFVLYESLVQVGIAVFRSLNIKSYNKEQTIQFKVNHKNFNINNVHNDIKVVLMQNNNWKTTIKGLKPRYLNTNQINYNYTQETNFSGGNEYHFFDSKKIRNSSLNIAKTELKNLWHHYLYTNTPLADIPYRNNQDINGQFVIRTLESNNPDEEADYTVTHFSLTRETPYKNEVYVYGGFNNFELTEETKMKYDIKTKRYFCKLKLKQGFYNYTFITADNNKKINFEEINGSFSETENKYTVIVYFKSSSGIYDRVIGVGNGFFNQQN